MRHPYLIRLDVREDYLDVRLDYEPGTKNLVEEQHDILWPEGPDQLYEFNDSHFFKATTYHEHSTGWETFFIHEGQADLCVRGKTATVGPGDVIHITPYTSHKMTTLTPPLIWNGMFHGIGMLATMHNWARINKTNPDMMNDPEIQANYLGNKKNIIRENPPYEERVPREELFEIRVYEKPLAIYDYPGVSMRQYTGRWENNGLTELWLAELKKGFKANYAQYNPNVDLFYVIDGEVMFTVADEEFVATKRCLVKIPRYAPRRFEALTDAKMYDAGGATHWLDFFGDMASLKKMSPDKYADKKYVNGIFSRHACFLESAVYEGQNLF